MIFGEIKDLVKSWLLTLFYLIEIKWQILLKFTARKFHWIVNKTNLWDFNAVWSENLGQISVILLKIF